MKKIIIVMTTIITMMLVMAAPMMYKPIKAHAEGSYRTKEQLMSDWETYNYYVYATGTRNGQNYAFIWCFNSYNESNAVVEPTHIRIQDAKKVGSLGGTYSFGYYRPSNPNDVSQGGGEFNTFDVNMESTTITYQNQYSYSGFTCDYIESNLLPSNELDLTVTVDGGYGFGGVITRKQTNPNTGVSSTADDLHFSVTNNGVDAQWVFAIVPTTQSLDFGSWIWTGRDNIVGNPTYCYASDEWITLGLEGINIFDSSASANAVYCPSVWHPSAAGTTTGYSIAYESMNITAGQSYQIVVYACRNPNMEEMSGFYSYNNGQGTTPNQLTSTYTVHGLIDEYEEVYRSLAFSITDPAVFNPNYTNPRDSSYAWDSNSDMKDLFQNGSAYRDEDGNVRIKGFKVGSSTLSWENDNNGTNTNNISSGSKNLSVQQSFGGFFNLFNWFLKNIPSDYALVIFFGVVTIVVIAIVKAVK